MNIKDKIEQIGDLIGKDELKLAINNLKELLKGSPRLDELIIQSARYNEIIKKIRIGTISLQDENITKNKIRFAILDILRDVEESIEQDKSLEKELNRLIRKEVKNSVNQNHYGKGDNIAGDKIINKK